jgi:nucleoside-diphosphate-sugar epimerase
MRILVLGGTRFLGPCVVRELAAAGHEITVFHRGSNRPTFPKNVAEVIGDFADFEKHADDLRRLNPQVVLDTAAFRAEEGRRVLAFCGVAQRCTVLSSCDVYRAFGRLLRTEPGEPDPTPLTEESPLRGKLTGAGERYNKTAVELEAQSDPNRPGTILRLPAIHGPGDWQHRLYDYARSMADHKPQILIDQTIANWCWARGFVANVAHAVALTTTDDRAAGRIYNVADSRCYTEIEWVHLIAQVMGYTGQITPILPEKLPESDRAGIDSRQQYVLDTSRIRSEVGYREIVSDEDGVRATVEWELANPPLS